MITYNNDINIANITAMSGILILEFGSTTCPPCSAISAKIDSYTALHTEIEAMYIPIEENRELAARMNVFSVPTVIVYVEGKLYFRESGYFSLENIFDGIDRLERLKR